ncbi:hypothetical protein BC831DRAFT_549768 [Entophlyctis helioformis]|nr:hypothetical protein BC831DRAFT_549768 [Entophlyctis helioformis]
MSSDNFDIWSTSTLTWFQVQNSNISCAAFAMLVVWGFSTSFKAYQTWRVKDKPIYRLNLAQSIFMLIKTTAACIYTVFLNLECEPRGILMNIPLIISLDLMYWIMLLKLLLFTPFRMMTRAVFAGSLLAHAAIVCVGVAQRRSFLSKTGTCRDTYPLVFKQQYILEIVLECFTAVVLVHGIALKSQVSGGQVLSSTYTLLNQLRKNEHLRVFSLLFLIAIKLILSYNSISVNFDYGFVTHAVDQARSAVVCWALMRDYRKLTKSTNSNSAHNSGVGGSMSQAQLGKAGSIMEFRRQPTGKDASGYNGGSMPSARVVGSKAVDLDDESDIGVQKKRVSGEAGRKGGIDLELGHGKGDAELSEDALARAEAIKSTETIANSQ